MATTPDTGLTRWALAGGAALYLACVTIAILLVGLVPATLVLLVAYKLWSAQRFLREAA